MPSQTLTARFVEGVKPAPARREYFDRHARGLALRVSPAGGKSWVLLYRHHRRLRRWTIGRYPTLSLADARELARAGLRDVERGQDPAQAKRDANEAITFAELATSTGKSPSSARPPRRGLGPLCLGSAMTLMI